MLDCKSVGDGLRMNFVGFDRCQSPIEEKMLDALTSACWVPYVVTPSMACNELFKAAWQDEVERRVFIAPQATFGRMRVDFILARHCSPTHPMLVAVECDGHAFHKATAEQIERDADRDRRLSRGGIATLRFSGSRINRNALRCAREALSLVIGERVQTYHRWRETPGWLRSECDMTQDA